MIPIVKPFLPPKEVLMEELEKTIYSGYIAQGSKVEEFEKRLREYFDCPYLLTVNSGTSALHLALILCGIQSGDEVISTPMTAEPTNTTIALTGAQVRWADVESKTGLISPKSIEEKLSPKTKAIVIVHYAGMVADMNSISEISKKYNIPVIEDCAHAFGARYKEKPLGYFSDYAIYSFQAIKHFTTIDGGLLITRKESDYERAKKLRWFGLDKNIERSKNMIEEAGFKYHMNDVNATIGLCQMNYLKSNVDEYVKNGRYFDEHINNKKLAKLNYHKNTYPSYWLYTLLTDHSEELIEYLYKKNIQASKLHKRNDLHPVFRESLTDLKGLNEFYSKFVHIGCGSWVSQSRSYIVDTLNKF